MPGFIEADYENSVLELFQDLGYQYAYGPDLLKVNCVDPGATATALNGFRGKQTIEEGTEIIVKMATIGNDRPTGVFVNREGSMPW